MRVSMFDPGNFTPYYVQNLVEELAGLDVEVSLITSAPLFEDVQYHDSIDVQYRFFQAVAAKRLFFRKHAILRQALKLLSYPFGLWRTWRALKHEPPGILHVHWSLFPLLDVVLIRALRSRGWRVVYTAHELLSQLERPLRRWGFGPIYREADAVIVHTPGLARKLAAWGGEDLREVRVIPEGVSTFPLSHQGSSGRARVRFLVWRRPVRFCSFLDCSSPTKAWSTLCRPGGWSSKSSRLPAC